MSQDPALDTDFEVPVLALPAEALSEEDWNALVADEEIAASAAPEEEVEEQTSLLIPEDADEVGGE